MDSVDQPESHLRPSLLLSGLAGLLAGGLLAAVCIWLVRSGAIPVLAPFPMVTMLLVIVFGVFSLAEIPMMVFLMRRLLVERPGNRGFVLGLNALYVFFAFVYGAPVILLTGDLGWGLGLCSLGIVRLIASTIYVRYDRSTGERITA